MDEHAEISVLKRVLPLFVVLAVSLAVRIPALHVPLDRDEGGFSYIAWNWQQGGVPYRDAFDNKPPLLYLAYRAAIATFGATSEGVHLFFILLGLLQVGLLYKLAKRWMGEEGALAAALIFSLLSAEPTYAVGTAGNASNIVLLPVILAAFWLPSFAGLAGLCMGAAVMVKQTALLQGLALGLWLVMIHKKRWEALCKYSLGALIVPSAFALYFSSRGVWADFIHATWTYNLQHAANVAQSGRMAMGVAGLFDNIRALAPAEWAFWFLATMGCVGVRGEKKGLLLWLLASLASLSVGLRFSSHYFVELAPPLALLAALGLEFFQASRRRLWVPLALFLGGFYFFANRGFFFGGSPESFSRSVYEGNYFVEAVPVARHIAETTEPSDRILVFGSEPEILFLAQRHSATRHIFFYPLTIERATIEARQEALAFQQEVVRDVESNPPDMIVWVNNPLSFLAGPTTDTTILNKGREWLKSGRYQFEGAVMAKPGQPARYYLGPEEAAKFDPAQIKQAAYALYRLRKTHGQ